MTRPTTAELVARSAPVGGDSEGAPGGSPRRSWTRWMVPVAAALVACGAGVSVAHGRASRDAVVLSAPVHEELLAAIEDEFFLDYDVAALARLPVAEIPLALDDRYTGYLSPTQYTEYQRHDRGTYIGIGVVAHAETRGLVLDDVLDGGPAAGAGLEPGDVMLSIDGRSLARLDTTAALGRLKGDIGTRIDLEVDRDGVVTDHRLIRAELKADVVRSEIREVGGLRVATLAVLDFSEGVAAEVRAEVTGLRNRGVDTLVLDLRGNPGGFVTEAVDTVSAFVAADTLVLHEEGRAIDPIDHWTELIPVDDSTPMAVLVDHLTASSAEIVAGALVDTGRAISVGTTTYGKGVIQHLLPLSDGGAARVTFAEYFRPSGLPVDRVGLAPEFEIDASSTADAVAFAAAAVQRSLTGSTSP